MHLALLGPKVFWVMITRLERIVYFHVSAFRFYQLVVIDVYTELCSTWLITVLCPDFIN